MVLSNFIILNELLMEREIYLPKNIIVEMFNRKTREMEYVTINVEKTLDDFNKDQHSTMLKITKDWKGEIIARQNSPLLKKQLKN